MWSLPYGRGTRAFKGNCIPSLLFLCTHTHTRTLVSKFIFDLDQKFPRSSGLNESISPYKHICFCKVNVTRKQICICSEFKKLWVHVQMIDKPNTVALVRRVGRTLNTEDRIGVCVCLCVCVSAYLKQIVLFVCSAMDITSSLQAHALHQRGRAKSILGREGKLQLSTASWPQLHY